MNNIDDLFRVEISNATWDKAPKLITHATIDLNYRKLIIDEQMAIYLQLHNENRDDYDGLGLEVWSAVKIKLLDRISIMDVLVTKKTIDTVIIGTLALYSIGYEVGRNGELVQAILRV